MAHSKADVIKRAETIRQGRQRGTSKYSTEFKMLVLQLGYKSNEPNEWVTRHYLRGLDETIRDALVPHLDWEKDTLDGLIRKANNIARNVEFGKSLKLDYGSNRPTPTSTSHTSSAQRPASGGYVPSPPGTKPARAKLSDADKDHLRRNKGCFSCGRINAGHIAENCPDRLAAAKPKELKEVKKESISALEAVVESDFDFEYSRPKPISTIKIATQVGKASLPSTLVDCGAMVNAVSEEKVTELAMPTRSMPPMKIHEPLNPHGTLVDKKVVDKVRIPSEDWESSRPAEFIVAPLKEHDAILGMPFLAEEGILIDPAQRKVILPPAASFEETSEKELDEGIVEDLMVSEQELGLEGEIEEELPVSAGLAGENKERLQVGEDGPVPSVYPSICPKLMTIPKIVPPQQDLKWIEAFQSFDAAASKLESVKLHEYLTKFNGTIPSDPKDRDEYFAKLNDYFIKR